MSDRDKIFERIRSALQPVHEAGKATPRPDYDTGMAVCRAQQEFASLWEHFAARLEAVNGTPLQGYDALGRWLQDAGLLAGFCDPSLAAAVRDLPEFKGIELSDTFERDRVDDYAFGITRAAGAIAESGTVILKDGSTASRLGALAPWVHVAVLEEGQLFGTLPEALSDLGDDPSVVWATGPSKTADIEGILIEGVHGPGVQIVCRV